MNVLANRIQFFWDAIIANKLDGIEDAYVQSEDTYVVLEGPRYTTRTFKEIISGWQDFTSSPIQLTNTKWVEGPYEEIIGEMGWIAGIADISIKVEDNEFTTRFRCSFVMVSIDGDWKIKHEHVSAPLPDPYGIGDWKLQSTE